jgi:GR25 family glycosyltransferase involved in LPS biosynthesis
MTFATYLINLDDRVDRLDEARAHLEKSNLQYVRISAVSQNPSIKSDFLTPTVYACWQSHLKTYSRFLESDYKYALIFEDDLVIKRDFNIDRYISIAEDLDLDLLQLGFLLPGLFNRIRWVYEEIEKCFFFGLSLISYLKPFRKLQGRMRVIEALTLRFHITNSSFLPGTHAYLIRRNFAQSILKEDPGVLSADEFFISLSKMRSFRMARLSRSVISQSKSLPSITSRYKSWGKR